MIGDGLFWSIILGVCIIFLIPIYSSWGYIDLACYLLAKKDAKEFEKERRKMWKEHLSRKDKV